MTKAWRLSNIHALVESGNILSQKLDFVFRVFDQVFSSFVRFIYASHIGPSRFPDNHKSTFSPYITHEKKKLLY